MMNSLLNLTDYTIEQSLIIKISKDKFVDKLYLNTEPGRWSFKLTLLKNSLLGIHLYHPEFSSISYNSENINPYDNVSSLSVSNDKSMTQKLLIKQPCETLSIYKNGFKLDNQYIKIHPANYHNRVVGLMFVI